MPSQHVKIMFRIWCLLTYTVMVFGEEDWMLHTPGGGPLQSRCPCMSRNLCPRMFGESELDLRHFGHIPICMDSRQVRCCGVSFRTLSETDVPQSTSEVNDGISPIYHKSSSNSELPQDAKSETTLIESSQDSVSNISFPQNFTLISQMTEKSNMDQNMATSPREEFKMTLSQEDTTNHRTIQKSKFKTNLQNNVGVPKAGEEDKSKVTPYIVFPQHMMKLKSPDQEKSILVFPSININDTGIKTSRSLNDTVTTKDVDASKFNKEFHSREEFTTTSENPLKEMLIPHQREVQKTVNYDVNNRKVSTPDFNVQNKSLQQLRKSFVSERLKHRISQLRSKARSPSLEHEDVPKQNMKPDKHVPQEQIANEKTIPAPSNFNISVHRNARVMEMNKENEMKASTNIPLLQRAVTLKSPEKENHFPTFPSTKVSGFTSSPRKNMRSSLNNTIATRNYGVTYGKKRRYHVQEDGPLTSENPMKEVVLQNQEKVEKVVNNHNGNDDKSTTINPNTQNDSSLKQRRHFVSERLKHRISQLTNRSRILGPDQE